MSGRRVKKQLPRSAYKKTPWARIWLAIDAGCRRGIRLTPDDLRQLGYDDALLARGKMDVDIANGEAEEEDFF